MEYSEDQSGDPCDEQNPMGSQEHHLGVEEGTFHFCSLHLHVLECAASIFWKEGEGKNINTINSLSAFKQSQLHQ